MKFNLKTGDFRKALSGSEAQIAKAVTAGMREATDGMKGDLQGDVTAGGLGPRLAKTWRGKTFPEGEESVEAAAFVYTKAPKLIDALLAASQSWRKKANSSLSRRSTLVRSGAEGGQRQQTGKKDRFEAPLCAASGSFVAFGRGIAP